MAVSVALLVMEAREVPEVLVGTQETEGMPGLSRYGLHLSTGGLILLLMVVQVGMAVTVVTVEKVAKLVNTARVIIFPRAILTATIISLMALIS